jgi:hypothetical protein
LSRPYDLWKSESFALGSCALKYKLRVHFLAEGRVKSNASGRKLAGRADKMALHPLAPFKRERGVKGQPFPVHIPAQLFFIQFSSQLVFPLRGLAETPRQD